MIGNSMSKVRTMKYVTAAEEDFENALRDAVMSADVNDLIVYFEGLNGDALDYQKAAARKIPTDIASMVQFPTGRKSRHGHRIFAYALQKRAGQ